MAHRQDLDQLHIEQRLGAANGDKIILFQTHANGSHHVVGRIELTGDQIEDAIYILTQAKARRDFERV